MLLRLRKIQDETFSAEVTRTSVNMDIPALRAILLAVLLSLCKVGAWSIAEEETLQTTLFGTYTTSVRPQDTTDVYVILMPLSLNTLDIGKQYMSFTIIYFVRWHDPRLTWTPASHGNIDTITVSPEKIWTPPIVVENAVTDVGILGGKNNDGTPLRIDSSGTVFWYPPLETSTSCEMKIANFPFEMQTCTIIVTGWGLASIEMNLTPGDMAMNYYSANGEWDLQSYYTSNGSFSNGAKSFTRLFMHFSFRRKWQFYGQNLLMPIVLTSLLMCFVFMVPLESGEKIGYALTVLLSYIVFLTWVTDSLPPISNDVSVLQVYLAIVLCLGVLATLLTCWVLNLYHRDPTKAMSSAMRVIVTRVLVPLRDFTFRNILTRNRKVQKTEVEPVSTYPGKQRLDLSRPISKVSEGSKVRLQEVFSSEPREEEVRKEPDYSWQEVAAMFDSLFFIVYLLIMPILTAVILGLLYKDYI